MANSMLRTALILGLLSAVGPFSIDMYLPALPLIEAELNTSVAGAQATLTAFFIAFGLSQLVYGPWADQAGRRVPLFFGIGLFLVASVGCALAPTIGWLTLARFVQGLGAAVVMVVPRAVIRDLHTGTQATRLMAMIMLVISVSPMLAPLAGSGLMLLGGWRLIFWVMVVAAVASITLSAVLLPETLRPEDRVPVNLRSLRRGAGVLFRDPVFMGLTFIGGFGMASFFVFIATAAFVYTGQFGLSPTGFSLAFAINAIGFFAASQLAAPLGERFGMVRVMALAVLGFALISCALAAVALAGYASLGVVVGMLFFANGSLGLVVPTTMVMALDPHGEIAGLASSLGGTMQMLTGGVMIVLAGPFFDGTATPMVITIALCSLGALGLARWILPRLMVEAAPG